MKKKLVALMAAVMVTAAMVAACGTNDTKTDADAETTPVVEETADVDAETTPEVEDEAEVDAEVDAVEGEEVDAETEADAETPTDDTTDAEADAEVPAEDEAADAEVASDEVNEETDAQ